jgi:hypothetical protein
MLFGLPQMLNDLQRRPFVQQLMRSWPQLPLGQQMPI